VTQGERRIGQFFIQVNGTDLPTDVMDLLDDAIVEDDLAQPAMFSLRFNDTKLTLIDGDQFRLGNEVRLGAAGSDGARKLLLIGEITGVEPAYNQTNSVLLVRGYDRSHRLQRGSKTRTFLKQSDDDIVQKIAREAGLRAEVEATRTRYEYVLQDNRTDLAFVRERAERIGYQATVEDRTLRFRPAEKSPSEAPALDWGVTLLEFRARLTAAAQPNKVEVRGWDPATKKAIVGKADRAARPSTIGDGQTGGKAAEQAFGSQATAVVSSAPVTTQSEADRLAQATLDDLSGDYLAAEGRCLGSPELRAGRLVEVKNLGRRLSGKYFVTATRHEYTAREGYVTTFFSAGRRPTSLLAALETPAASPATGVASAIVTNVNDPDRLGRVKVSFPWLDESHESHWVRVATPGAGAKRGLIVTPEVDDEVLVAFEHGDLSRPYVIGGLWNGKDKPPAEAVKGGKIQTRSLTTRAGHHITLYDDDGAGKIEVKTAKHTLVLDDSGSGKVEVKSAKHTLVLDDAGMGKIAITSGGDVELSGTGGKLSISSSGVELSATAKLDLKAGAVLNINGAMVNIN
jgi:uncharacterized protein involved in type VI secretion and phage assembly